MEQKSCVIVGAGLSGLTAAHFLTKAGWQVTLLDKGRGPGGRLASRSFGGGRFDHGAQYFSVKTPDFEEIIAPLRQRGLVVEWNIRPDGHPRYAVRGGLSGLAKALAEGLDVRRGVRVVSLTSGDSGHILKSETGATFTASQFLITLPVPQALALFDVSKLPLTASDQATLATIDYDPCWAVMATLNAPSRIPAPGGLTLAGGPVAWLADNQQKGISDLPAVTLHASAAWSREHLEDDPETVQRHLLEAVRDWVPAETVETVQTHRWRYSHAVRRLEEPFLKLNLPLPLLLGGDAFGPGNVEGAFLSGKAMAAVVATDFSP